MHKKPNKPIKPNIMNAQRRKAISKLIEQIEGIQSDIEMYKDEEEECYYNLPDSIQESERGEAMQDAISQLDDAYNSLDDVISYLEEAIQ